jgi:hypothetical protein
MSAEVRALNIAAPVVPHAAAVFKHIKFVDEPEAAATVLCAFGEPRRCAAVEARKDPAAGPTVGGSEDGTDELTVALLPADAGDEAAALNEHWMAGASPAQARFAIARGTQKLAWRPGRAIVQGPPASLARSLEVLVSFAFYEGELRRLERALEACDAQAQRDIALAHRIRFRDRRDWPRLVGLSEYFSGLRLTYVRLAPLLAASHRLAPQPRQVMEQLLEQADVAARLDAASERLEAYEDLYEGAVDRIAEHRWYVEGHCLEVGIVMLLLLEFAVLLIDLVAKHAQ